MDIGIDKIKEIIKLMEEHDLQEIEVENEGTKVRLKKRGADVQFVAGPAAVSNVAGTSSGVEAGVRESTGVAHNFVEVKAPMVGTFYRAPSPGADPFVDKGDTVNSGDTLCIIEAMKLMNEIKAEFKGRIVDILVENAEPVEFGQVLFFMEPA